MSELQKNQISHSLVITAMIMLMAALGIGSGMGIAISFIAIVLTACAVVISMIKSQEIDSEEQEDKTQ